MLKDITLGQYFPGESLFHRLDARIKIIIAILFITEIFLCSSIFSFALLIAVTVAITLLSSIPIRLILKSLKPLIIIIIFTAIINIFWTGGENLVFEWKFIKIYREGLVFAFLMVIRVIALIAGTSVILTYTTTPSALTDAIERLLSPLKILHLPVHEFAMMMTIALRFIPTLIRETDIIMNAQKARGVDFSTGNIAQRAKAMIPILIPLFVSAFRRADELANAMECRCYRGGKGMTRMTTMKLAPRDFVMLILFVVLGVLTVLINIYVPGLKI